MTDQDDRRKSDAQLIREAHEGAEPLGELYQRYVSAIGHWFHARAPAAEASELTAETFAQVALSLRRFEDRAGGSAGPWIYGIARNQLRRYYEREQVDVRARRRLGLPTDSYVSAFDEAEERIDAERAGSALDAALGSLSNVDRHAVELRVVDELNYDQVGRALGCTEVAARIRVMRALQRLSGLFESAR